MKKLILLSLALVSTLSIAQEIKDPQADALAHCLHGFGYQDIFKGTFINKDGTKRRPIGFAVFPIYSGDGGVSSALNISGDGVAEYTFQNPLRDVLGIGEATAFSQFNPQTGVVDYQRKFSKTDGAIQFASVKAEVQSRKAEDVAKIIGPKVKANYQQFTDERIRKHVSELEVILRQHYCDDSYFDCTDGPLSVQRLAENRNELQDRLNGTKKCDQVPNNEIKEAAAIQTKRLNALIARLKVLEGESEQYFKTKAQGEHDAEKEAAKHGGG